MPDAATYAALTASTTDGGALCELVAETVEFTTRDGAALSYCRPSIKVIGPWHNPDQHTT
ncbi:hypothetical protein AQJ91_14375 [Streptomyces dysideae]|uniref:Uncharacterized protein n=1 Tax=Streptomyces dysideae TaxID=909626 RepID=A0A117S0X8_9ACTN|nr:hypothetical protein AQJ91_14375 [Streptomyces dysideae]